MALNHTNNSLLIGRKHIRLKRINSTNKYAVDIISKSKPIEGTVISASYQYEGKGQIGRYWESEDQKNITCSTILHPTFLLAHDQFQLNMAVSLAIHDFIDHFARNNDHQVKIKWPNDIYVDNYKIAGILIQNNLKGKHISSSIIGTGININQTRFSEEIPNPISLALLLKSEIDIESAFQWLFRFLTKRYLQLSAGHIAPIRQEYMSNLYRKDVWSEFKDGDNITFSGKIVDIDDSGQLIIEMKDGGQKSFAFREIKFVINI